MECKGAAYGPCMDATIIPHLENWTKPFIYIVFNQDDGVKDGGGVSLNLEMARKRVLSVRVLTCYTFIIKFI